MSNMKCPVCKTGNVEQGKYDKEYFCDNEFCPSYDETDSKTYDILIRTRKALDVAKDTIRHADWFFDGDYNVDAKTMHNEIKYAIKAITTLEQKDK